MSRMNDAEAIMWAVEKDPALRSDFVNVTLLDRPPDRARVRATVERAVDEITRLAERVVNPPLRIAPPEWQRDPGLDLDYHLRTVGLPAPGDMRELLACAEGIAARPFDRARPLWELTVVEGLADGRAAFLQKVHHTVTDGVGGVKLSLALLDFEREPAEASDAEVSPARAVADEAHDRVEAAARADPVTRTSSPGVLAGALAFTARRSLDAARQRAARTARLMLRPDDAARGVADAVAAVDALRRQVVIADPHRSPLLAPRSIGMRFDTLSVPLSTVKAAGKRLGCSVNDVFVTAVAGALGAYHDRMGEPCDELRMAMPVNLRGEGADEPGNNFSPTRLVVPTGPKDPVERLERVRRVISGARDDPGVTATWSMARLVAPLPTAMLVTLARSQARTIDFVASNLRGSPVDLYLGGARLEGNFPMGPRAGCAVNVTTLSYRDSLDIGLNSDPAAISDPEALVTLLDESFADLVAAGSA